MLARFFAYLQYLLPKYWLTSIVYRLARIRHPGFKNLLIRNFVKLYDVETDDIRLQLPDDFANFNEFFIRELEADARPVDNDPQAIVSPVDGTVSQSGQLRASQLLQAKGIEYSLDDLLATNLDEARAYADGIFATIYLAPYNYHRVHAPVAGKLVAGSYVPGDLFSVNTATARHVKGLFSRNERLILHFETAQGPAALVFVGAMNVGSITTPWTGEIRPRHSGSVDNIDFGDEEINVAKGQLLGWFNMGSTVILLLPPGSAGWSDKIGPGNTLQMGESIGKLR